MLHVLQDEHDLEQRSPRLRPGGREDVDEAFERHVGVCERGEVGGADGVEELAERPVRVYVGAQYERVDEHPDQVVECRLTTSCDGRADGEVAAADSVDSNTANAAWITMNKVE